MNLSQRLQSELIGRRVDSLFTIADRQLIEALEDAEWRLTVATIASDLKGMLPKKRKGWWRSSSPNLSLC
jgi:hypothetical protein